MARAPSVNLVVARHGEWARTFESALGDGDRARLAGETAVGQLRLLAGRAAMLRAAAGLLGVDLGRLSIRATCPDCGRSHGRPIVVGATAPVHVSLSHAHGRAFAVAARRPIGIDAESRSDPQARRRAAVVGSPDPARDPIRQWTRVEAVLKADGRGLRVDPRDVTVGLRRGRVLDLPASYRVRTTRSVDGCVVSIARADHDSGSGGTRV